MCWSAKTEIIIDLPKMLERIYIQIINTKQYMVLIKCFSDFLIAIFIVKGMSIVNIIIL